MIRTFLGAPSGRCLTALMILAPLVAACSSAGDNIRVPRMDEYNSDRGRNRVQGSLLGGTQQGFLVFGTDRSDPAGRSGAGGEGGGGIGVNAYLWRATLDTLSFMPLASADPFGGVVITDWYSPPGQNERFRATALILGRQLRSDGVRVVVHRQEQSRGGAWVDAPVSASTATELEDQVLQRARELRSQSAAVR